MAVAQIRGGVPEGLPVSDRGASRNRTILPVLQPGTPAPESRVPDPGGDLAGASMTPVVRLAIRNGALLNSGTLSPNPWDLPLSGQNGWHYNGGTRTEDKAPQGCDLSADSSAGMARGGFDAEAVPPQNQTRRILAYCRPKMVLTTGSTLRHGLKHEKRDISYSLLVVGC